LPVEEGDNKLNKQNETRPGMEKHRWLNIDMRLATISVFFHTTKVPETATTQVLKFG